MEGLSMNNTLTRARNESRIKPLPIIIVIAALALLVVLNVVVDGKFLTFQNFTIILSAATVPAFVAWGFSYLFACGITDLSAGAIIVLAATASAIVGNALGYVPMFIAAVLVGVLCLAVNMTLFQVTKIPPWIAGLGMTMVYETIAGYYSQVRVSQGLRVEGLADEMRVLGRSPAIYIMLVIGFIIAYVTYNKTSIGLNARAVGGNADVAQMMGINTRRALMLGGLMAGFFFGFAGVMKESYAGYVVSQTGLSSLSTVFQPLAAVLLAQALQKHINIAIGIPISTFLIAMIFNILTLMGVPSGTFQEFLLGVIVVVFGITAQRNVKGVARRPHSLPHPSAFPQTPDDRLRVCPPEYRQLREHSAPRRWLPPVFPRPQTS